MPIKATDFEVSLERDGTFYVHYTGSGYKHLGNIKNIPQTLAAIGLELKVLAKNLADSEKEMRDNVPPNVKEYFLKGETE